MRREGISSILGAAIAIAIFFTVIVPAWVYMQNLQTLYMEEVRRRLQFELERLNEELEIHATMTPPDAFGRRALYAILHNTGPLSLTIPTIYIESTRSGLTQASVDLTLAPGQLMIHPLGYVLAPGEEVIVKAATMRGNTFTAPETLLGPSNLPYMLIVTITNMTEGYRYEVEVSVDGLLGCVSPASGALAEGCMAEVSESAWPYGPNDRQRSLAFMTAPGTYAVRLMIYEWRGSGWGLIEDDEARVNVTDHLSIRFQLPEAEPLDIIPLRVHSPRPNALWILEGRDPETVLIPFTVSLGNMSTALRDIEVDLTITSTDKLTRPGIVIDRVIIQRLAPGESYHGYFVIEVGLAEGEAGQMSYSIFIVGARREDTGDAISQGEMERAELQDLKLTFTTYSNLVQEGRNESYGKRHDRFHTSSQHRRILSFEFI